MHRLTLAVVPVLVWGLGAPVSAQDGPVPATPSIVTTGEAVVRRAPDQSFVTVSVESRARNPRDAQRQNAETMTAVQQRIAAAGVPRTPCAARLQHAGIRLRGAAVSRGYLSATRWKSFLTIAHGHISCPTSGRRDRLSRLFDLRTAQLQSVRRSARCR